MDSPLRLCLWDSLYAMDSGLTLEDIVDIVAGNLGDYLPDTSKLAGALGKLPGFPALTLGIAKVHFVKIASEEGRLNSTSSGADFEDCLVRARCEFLIC